MRRYAWLSLIVVLLGALVAGLLLRCDDGEVKAPGGADPAAAPRIKDPLGPLAAEKTMPAPNGPLQLPPPAEAVEPVERGAISGAVLDPEGLPVAGILVCAHWPVNDEFGEPVRLHGADWSELFRAEHNGSVYPRGKWVRRSETRTGADGLYVLKGIPGCEVQLTVRSKRHRFDPYWRTQARAGDAVNWTATQLHEVKIELAYPDGIELEGTQVSVTKDGQYGGSTFAEDGRRTARVLPGRNTFTATNYEFGLQSKPVELEVTPAGGTVLLVLEKFARFEVAVQFSGATLHTEFELAVAGTATDSGGNRRYASLRRYATAGVWAESLPAGEYRVTLTCLKREIASQLVSYDGGRQRFEVAVPEPSRADCCVVTTNATPPVAQEVLTVDYGGEHTLHPAVVWITAEGRWLLQPSPKALPDQATGLSIHHSGWGRISVNGSVRPGDTIYAGFQRPCMFRYEVSNVPFELESSLQTILRNATELIVPRSDIAIAVQPGDYELILTSDDVPGEVVLTRKFALRPGANVLAALQLPDLVAVKFKFPPTTERSTLTFAGKINVKQASRGLVYLFPGNYTVDYEPRYGFVYTRTFTATEPAVVRFDD